VLNVCGNWKVSGKKILTFCCSINEVIKIVLYFSKQGLTIIIHILLSTCELFTDYKKKQIIEK